MRPRSAFERRRAFEELTAKNAVVRRQFLVTELATCETTVQIGEAELATGNMPTVDKEIAAVEKGIRTIHRFLPGIAPEERGDLVHRLAELEASVRQLRNASARRTRR